MSSVTKKCTPNDFFKCNDCLLAFRIVADFKGCAICKACLEKTLELFKTIENKEQRLG